MFLSDEGTFFFIKQGVHFFVSYVDIMKFWDLFDPEEKIVPKERDVFGKLKNQPFYLCLKIIPCTEYFVVDFHQFTLKMIISRCIQPEFILKVVIDGTTGNGKTVGYIRYFCGRVSFCCENLDGLFLDFVHNLFISICVYHRLFLPRCFNSNSEEHLSLRKGFLLAEVSLFVLTWCIFGRVFTVIVRW